LSDFYGDGDSAERRREHNSARGVSVVNLIKITLPFVPPKKCSTLALDIAGRWLSTKSGTGSESSRFPHPNPGRQSPPQTAEQDTRRAR